MSPLILFFIVSSLLSASALPSLPALPSFPGLRLSELLLINSNSSLNAEVECFPLSPQRQRITVDDCTRTLNYIFRTDQQYGERQRWAWPVGRKWILGPCGIALVPVSEAAVDIFSLAWIDSDLQEIITTCVAADYLGGGRVRVGRREMYNIIVIGMMAI